MADTITALGNVISGDLSEVETLNHMTVCACATYNKWSRILESQASLGERGALGGKTMQHFVLWGVANHPSPGHAFTLLGLLMHKSLCVAEC